MGAFRPGRSDLDFVAILDRELSREELARLRAIHLGRWVSSLARAVAMGARWPLVCNGIYLRLGDLARSPLKVTPVAGHVAGRFRVASATGFDVNPVTWHMLARHGVAIRGAPPATLRIHTDVRELRHWSLGNLNSYWRRWSQRTLDIHALPRRAAAAGVLGAPRLHCTVATGDIIGKETAGEYALETFDPQWHPLIQESLAFWRRDPTPGTYAHRPIRLRQDAGAFVATIIQAANQLPVQ